MGGSGSGEGGITAPMMAAKTGSFSLMIIAFANAPVLLAYLCRSEIRDAVYILNTASTAQMTAARLLTCCVFPMATITACGSIQTNPKRLITQ